MEGMWKTRALAAFVAVWAAGLAAAAGAGDHFEVEASFEAAAEPGESGAVAVRFVAFDPDVELNEVPAPRLKLDPDQQVLVERKSAATPPPLADPGEPRYHDLSEPVRFSADPAPDAPAGFHAVGAEVVYFYCSKREGWCRRGSAEIEIPVQIQR